MDWIKYGRKYLMSSLNKENKQNIVAIALDKKDKILAISTNSYIKTHPMQYRYANKVGRPYCPYIHAEIGALIKAKSPVYKLVVVRVNKNGDLRLAMPCPICQEAIKDANVSSVEYSVG